MGAAPPGPDPLLPHLLGVAITVWGFTQGGRRAPQPPPARRGGPLPPHPPRASVLPGTPISLPPLGLADPPLRCRCLNIFNLQAGVEQAVDWIFKNAPPVSIGGRVSSEKQPALNGQKK